MIKDSINWIKRVFAGGGLAVMVGILVLVSIVLSAGLWYNIGRIDSESTNQKHQIQENQMIGFKPMKSLYTFNQIVLNDGKKQYSYLEYQDAIRKVVEKVEAWQLQAVIPKEVDDKAYLEYLNQPDVLVLNYPAELPGDLVEENLGQSLSLSEKASIDRLVVPLSGKGKVAFMDDENQRIYESIITNSNNQKISMDDLPKKRYKATFSWYNDAVHVDYLERLSVKTKSYFVDKTNDEEYVAAVFADSANVPKRIERKDELMYTDQDARQLTVARKTGSVDLRMGNAQTFNTEKERMENAYNWLAKLKKLPENMYYFDEADGANKLTYRLHIDGTPIFNTNNLSMVELRQVTKHRSEISFGRYSVQIPLPDHGENEINLANTDEVRSQLVEAGLERKEIQNIMVGYIWQDRPNERFVRLTPSWFVKYKGEWASYDAVLRELRKGN